MIIITELKRIHRYFAFGKRKRILERLDTESIVTESNKGGK